jgi:hypothetical protein
MIRSFSLSVYLWTTTDKDINGDTFIVRKCEDKTQRIAFSALFVVFVLLLQISFLIALYSVKYNSICGASVR